MLQAHVSAAKAAIDALFRVMAVEYGPFGVRANIVAPGGVEQTEGLARLLPKAALDRARQSVPLGYAEVADIENACLFCESPSTQDVGACRTVLTRSRHIRPAVFSSAARKITGTITVDDGDGARDLARRGREHYGANVSRASQNRSACANILGRR